MEIVLVDLLHRKRWREESLGMGAMSLTAAGKCVQRAYMCSKAAGFVWYSMVICAQGIGAQKFAAVAVDVGRGAQCFAVEATSVHTRNTTCTRALCDCKPQERLADAQTEATHADSEAKAADVRAKHLAKQLADQQKVCRKRQVADQQRVCVEKSSWQTNRRCIEKSRWQAFNIMSSRLALSGQITNAQKVAIKKYHMRGAAGHANWISVLLS